MYIHSTINSEVEGAVGHTPVLLMDVTPVIMLQMISGSTIIFNRLRNRSPNSAMRLMTCDVCMRT